MEVMPCPPTEVRGLQDGRCDAEHTLSRRTHSFGTTQARQRLTKGPQNEYQATQKIANRHSNLQLRVCAFTFIRTVENAITTVPRSKTATNSATMQEIIEIIHCCKPIDRDEIKYQTDIIATSCIWLENLDVDYTLQDCPEEGNTYFIILNRPVRFSLDMKLWLFYDSPLAFYNGYTKEAEIDQALFCYGQITKIISYNEFGATVAFTVSKTKNFQEILRTNPIKELPEVWTNFFIGFIEKNDYTLETFGKFYQFSAAAAQGGLGQVCIFTEFEHEFMICKFYEWNFCENATLGGKYKLPERIKQLILPGK
jgi:hypothetical protein